MPRMIVILADAREAKKRRIVGTVPLHERLLGEKSGLGAKGELQSRHRWPGCLDRPLEVSRKVFRPVWLRGERIDQTHRRRLHVVVRIFERDSRYDRWRRKLVRREDDENRRKVGLDEQPPSPTIVVLKLSVLGDF